MIKFILPNSACQWLAITGPNIVGSRHWEIVHLLYNYGHGHLSRTQNFYVHYLIFLYTILEWMLMITFLIYSHLLSGGGSTTVAPVNDGYVLQKVFPVTQILHKKLYFTVSFICVNHWSTFHNRLDQWLVWFKS